MVRKRGFVPKLSIASVFIDAGVSGSLALADRPVLMEAVTAFKRRDVLLVAKRDRLGRDVIEVAMIERLVAKRGARVVSAAGEGTETDEPSALLMRRLIDSYLHVAGLSLRAIATTLNQRGLRTRSGALWRYEYVRNVLRASVTVARFETISDVQ